MVPPLAVLTLPEDRKGGHRRNMAASGLSARDSPASASPPVNVQEVHRRCAPRWERRELRSVYKTGRPRVLTPWLWRLALTCMHLLYAPRRRCTAYRGGDTGENSVCALAFTLWAHASEPPLKQPVEEAPGPPSSKHGESVEVSNPLRQLKLPEGLIEGLQNVEWGALFSTGAAELDVALSEGRELAKELMQSGRIQQFLRTLRVDKIEESLESLAEDLGFKEKLPAQLLRERRILEISYVPIFVFARERLLGRSRDDEETAQKIALEDPQLKAVVKNYENVPPAQSMSKAPNMLDGLYDRIVEVTTVLKNSRPVALSLASRVEFLTRDFVDYCRAVFSAVTKYISYVNRFHKNKKALFFFAQRTLPRVLKILLLLNRLEEILLHRGRAEFAENPREPDAMLKKARQLSAVTTDLINALDGIAQGCLAASSPHFQVDFAKALSVYDKGEDPVAAFQAFLEAPELMSHEGESPHFQQQPRPHATGKRGSTGTRGSAASSGQQGETRAHDTKRNNDIPSSNGQKHRQVSGVEATDYIEVISAHLDELQGMRRQYTSEIVVPSNMEQTLPPTSQVTLSTSCGALPVTPLPLSPVMTEGGALGGGIPLESFAPFSRRVFLPPLSQTNPAAGAPSDSIASPSNFVSTNCVSSTTP